MQMTATTRRLLMALYIIAVALALLYLRFPSEALRTFVAHRLSGSLPGMSIAVEDVRPSLPAAVVLHGVRISSEGQTLAVIDRLRINPDLLSLLQDKSNYELSGAFGGGEITGTAEVDSASPVPKISASAQVNGVLLQQLAGLRGLYGSKLSGRLDGNITVSPTGTLTGKFTVTEAKVELAAPVFNQKDFTFKTFDAVIALQNRNVTLRNGRLRGNEVDAEVSGTIALAQPQGSNAMNLMGRLNPHPAFLARAEAGLPPNLLRRRTGIPFKVSGPLDSPGFSLN
jgi:type II secretion system protein N